MLGSLDYWSHRLHIQTGIAGRYSWCRYCRAHAAKKG